MATDKTALVEPKTVKFLFNGDDPNNAQIYTNNGLTFESGTEVILSASNLPAGFPFTLGELAVEASRVSGMEVTQID